jgi:hypothetical protein
MASSPSFFQQLQSDQLELIELTLDVAPGPGSAAVPLLERSDGPPCETPDYSRHNIYARGYSNQRALEFSLRVRFAEKITGYTPSKVRRATTKLVAPADKILFYRSDEIRWTDVLQRASIDKRIQADLDAFGCEVAVFEVEHEPEAVGLAIRHSLLEALDPQPELDIIVVSSAPNVPSLYEHEPARPNVQRSDSNSLASVIAKFVLNVLHMLIALAVQRLMT